ncbi:MAG: peptidoglycan DD-metalloendopeptidase family protein [Muribaculum sp.]|nr:peptidoglycan DD-metalloendopeptidase family protein [Muribaculaceae bacterium]MCM1080999.1 peptidoglycan DD-metalloendopeptidase family protein [Muribaculum sp.]
MKRLVLCCLLICALLCNDALCATPKKNRTSAAIRKEQQQNKNAIAKTNRQLAENKRRTTASLRSLDALNAEIQLNKTSIGKLSAQIDSIDHRQRLLADTVILYTRQLEAMKTAYAKSVRATRSAQQNSLTRLAFVLSSESFATAYRRSRYLNEYTRWQKRKTQEITKSQQVLEAKSLRLDSLKRVQASKVKLLAGEQSALESRQRKTDRLVKQLKKENRTLQKVLKDKQLQAQRLDSELDRIIAKEIEQQRLAKAKAKTTSKSADNKSTTQSTTTKNTRTETYATAKSTQSIAGSFADNKGNLLFPVSGKYKIVRAFGRQKHPQLPHVVVDNSGIDIEVEGGGNARAVFAGKVSAIFKQSGFGTIVMVRHGEYLTIYANLANINVKNGSELKQGQSIGRIARSDDGRSIMHFELRKEKQKLDPMLWVK